ncbi:MAG: extracellular solute-binding protein [Firmicutes bacterium]|nr:extracellular solute-binding protein [Bacillota bacterium]
MRARLGSPPIRCGSLPLLLLLLFMTVLFLPGVYSRNETVLTLWTHQRHMANLIQQLITEFNATEGYKKRIRITMRVLGDESWNIFHEAQKRGEGPDLYSSGFDTHYDDPWKAGALAWFDDLPGFAEWKRKWPSWYWIEGTTTYQGHVYTIPTQVLNSRLIYNRDLFRLIGRDPDSPPRSYADLRDIARKITKAGKGWAFGFAYTGDGSWPFEWMPSQWAEANGEPAYWDWKQGRWAMKGFQRVFQLLLDLQRDGSLFPGATQLSNEALRAQFAEGRIGMFMGEFWDVGVLNDQYRAKCDWGVASIPTYDGKFHGRSRAMMIGGLWNINGQSRHKLEAWEVVKWFSRYEIRAKMYEQGKCIDPDPEVQKYVKISPQKVNGFEAFASTLEQEDYLATYPILPGWKKRTDNPCTLFRQILLAHDDLGARLADLERVWNQALDEYYRKNPRIKRGWNIYPHFNRRTYKMGAPLIKPVFTTIQ